MKKGKTAKIKGYENTKITYGTVDCVNLKSIYLNLQTWAEPISDNDNWNRVVLNLSRSIKHSILSKLNSDIFKPSFIVDLDLRHSGISYGKRSFMNLDINFYLNDEPIDFKSLRLKSSLNEILSEIYNDNIVLNKYFKFFPTKNKLSTLN